MVKEFEKRGHECLVCSPTGPDVRLGSRSLIRKLGGVGVLYFWWCVKRHFNGRAVQWDAVWLHWPMFLGHCPFPAALATFHGTYRGFRGMARDMRSPWHVRQYYAFMEMAERRYLRPLEGGGHDFSAVSRRTVVELSSQGVSSDRVTYVPVGVDTERFHPLGNRADLRAELGLPTEALVLLYVGRLSRPKNLFRLIDTFAQLKAKVERSVLLIVGMGELEKPLARYVEEKTVSGIRLLGFIPNHELPMMYTCADFFVMASRYEGQPVVLLEALACGLPPILSDIPAMRDVVEESGIGLLVDFNDPHRAAGQIEGYVSSPRAQDSLAGRDYVVSSMSSAVCAEKYLQLMARVSQKPP
jgi:glycosyltransferase involved in cell wall biosynthesis